MISEDAEKVAATGRTDFEVTDAGLSVAINLATLIEAVHVAPGPSFSVDERVREALHRAGLDLIPVLQSRLGEPPRY